MAPQKKLITKPCTCAVCKNSLLNIDDMLSVFQPLPKTKALINNKIYQTIPDTFTPVSELICKKCYALICKIDNLDFQLRNAKKEFLLQISDLTKYQCEFDEIPMGKNNKEKYEESLKTNPCETNNCVDSDINEQSTIDLEETADYASGNYDLSMEFQEILPFSKHNLIQEKESKEEQYILCDNNSAKDLVDNVNNIIIKTETEALENGECYEATQHFNMDFDDSSAILENSLPCSESTKEHIPFDNKGVKDLSPDTINKKIKIEPTDYDIREKNSSSNCDYSKNPFDDCQETKLDFTSETQKNRRSLDSNGDTSFEVSTQQKKSTQQNEIVENWSI